MARDATKGMHWIGHPGSLHPIADLGEESFSLDVAVSVEVGMGGGERVRVSRHRPPRSWSLTIPNAHADEIEGVRSLLASTVGPYVLVTSDAQVSNVLTPERSVLSSTSVTLALSGGWPVEGGRWATFTRANPSAAGGALGVVRVGPAPIPPVRTGRQVTASILLATGRAGGARAGIEWLNSAGAPMATAWGEFVTGMDLLRRSHVTAPVPWGAAACQIITQHAEVLSQPQVTWTDDVIPEWTVGNGADRVHISASSRSTGTAVPDRYALRRSDYQVSLVESGPSS